MRREWRCVRCHAELGEIVRDGDGRPTLVIWTDSGATVKPSGGDFEITCSCGSMRSFYGGWLRFARRSIAA